MPERNRVLRVAAQLARGRAIDWDAEERAAETEEDRAAIQQLRAVAAMSIVGRALMSAEAGEDLSESISQARDLAAPAHGLPLGTRWGPLEILERVGGGAFGDVYRARDPRLDREVALKILGRDVSDPNTEVVREARLLAAVRHPNVVMVHGADRIAGQVGIWTEFLHGQTLDEVLRERGVLGSREAALIGIDLCGALSAAHAAGIIHQDVKLSNIMRAHGGRIVLMDFGLGRESDPVRSSEKSRQRISGTPLFMAPEVLRGERPDARSDLYSLGVVLFSLVTASLPVEASTLDGLRAKHARGERRHARDLRPDLPEVFVQVLDRALAHDPRERYQTGGDAERGLLACLRAPVHGGTEAGSKPSRPMRPTRPTRSTLTVSYQLPTENDAFIGREADLVELAERFRRDARLVTLQGPGGIGKTRLAARYGWNSLDEWPGGTWFCDLTEATTRDGIASAVGESLGVPLGTGDAVELLGHAIASRGQCLIILDNFEQVVERAAETIVPWLGRAPAARILVTSRERLNLPGEDVQTIDALPLERGVELFVERARRQRPIELDGPETQSVREVVQLLEGIPLAIELSAARIRVMTPAQMVDRIAERFRLLASSGTGRHATLRAAIDGSWELLNPWEKAAFAQCGVFEGGFTLEAAEGVLDLRAWPDAPWVVDVLQSLVDKSLLRSRVPERDLASARPAIRFGMFVSLQEYAREKLAEEESLTAAVLRHGHWFARFGEDEAIDALDRRGGVDSRRALVPELDNLVAACRRMAMHGDGRAAVGSYRAAWAVFELKGPLATAVELGTGVAATPLEPEERAGLLQALGHAKQRAGRMDDARADFETSLAIHRERGYRNGEGRSLALLATVFLNEGRLTEASAQFEEALAIHREVGDRRTEGVTVGNLGLAYHEQRRLEEASVHLESSLAIHREVGNRRSEGVVLGNLGNLRRDQDRSDEARNHFEAALAIHREVGNRRFEGIVLDNLGSLCRTLGLEARARDHFEAALAIHREVGARRFEGQALNRLGDLFLATGQLDEADTRYEAALAIHRSMGNQRAEGVVLEGLSRLRFEQGRIAEARDLISTGVALLRSADYRVELAKLLCTRAEYEAHAGEAAGATNTMEEAESIAVQAGLGPDSELSQRLAALRQAIERMPPN